jgi:hypothetical protein
VSTAAFGQPGPIQDSVKMGALGSFFASFLAIVVAWSLNIKPETEVLASPSNAEDPDPELASA